MNVVLTESNVVQKDDYRPFGLTFNSYQRVTGEWKQISAPSYLYAVEEPAYDGDKIAYNIVSWFVDEEDNPYAARKKRLIPFSEAIAHETRHAVEHIRNNINGSHADNENNAIVPLNRWRKKKSIPQRPKL